MQPEAQLLLLSATGDLRHPAVERLLGEDIDWPRLLMLAVHQKAAGVLCRQLSEAGLDARIPADAAAALRRHAMVAEFRQVRLRQRLEELAELLERSGIRVLLLKGAALAHTIYPSFDDRPMGDLDILVPKRHAQDVLHLLLANGWRTTALQLRKEFYSKHQHLAPLEDADVGGVRLEIHTDLFFEGHPFRFSSEEVWRRAVPLRIGGATAWTLDAPLTIVHLCLHFFWSHMARVGVWRTFRDLHQLTSRTSIDWSAFSEAALESRAASSCYWTLRLARSLSGLAVPDDVLARLRPPGAERLLARLERHFAAGVLPSPTPCPSVRLSRLMWLAAVRPRWSGHGRSVPWLQEEPVSVSAADEARPPGMAKLRSQWQQLHRWRRYLGFVLNPRSLGAAMPET